MPHIPESFQRNHSLRKSASVCVCVCVCVCACARQHVCVCFLGQSLSSCILVSLSRIVATIPYSTQTPQKPLTN
uniref:Uncharacterized protein n=1 Tax=Anguilla anguilla TaxID=7936 RepID=A0A0E9WQM4_ANGAN